ncbi:MAG: helix-turn-helix domain-containing protein [Lachnospiraceae bacterium]
MDKGIFTTRFKDCCKEKGYKYEDVASKIGISVDGLKHYLRKSNPNFPPLDVVIKMAEIFDVDIEYLVNEHRGCKKYESETICDVTMLNEESAEVLRYLDSNSAEMLGELLIHPKFEYMLAQIVHYVRFSRNEELVSYDTALDYQESIDADKETQKALKKYQITDTFSKILDDLYYIYDDLEFEIEKVKDFGIDMIAHSIEQNDDLEDISYWIVKFQQELMKLSPSDPLCYRSDDYFIQNIEKIMKER